MLGEALKKSGRAEGGRRKDQSCSSDIVAP